MGINNDGSIDDEVDRTSVSTVGDGRHGSNRKCAEVWANWTLERSSPNSAERHVFAELAGELERFEQLTGMMRSITAEGYAKPRLVVPDALVDAFREAYGDAAEVIPVSETMLPP